MNNKNHYNPGDHIVTKNDLFRTPRSGTIVKLVHAAHREGNIYEVAFDDYSRNMSINTCWLTPGPTTLIELSLTL